MGWIDPSTLALVAAVTFTFPQLRALNHAIRMQITNYVDPDFLFYVLLLVSLFRLIVTFSGGAFLMTMALMVVYNFDRLAQQFNRLKQQNLTLERTLNQNKAAYMALLDEKNEVATQLRKSKQESASRRSLIGSDLAKQLLSAQVELQQMKDRCAALEKQSDMNRNELVRLQQEKDALRKQLNCFETIFGKKAS